MQTDTCYVSDRTDHIFPLKTYVMKKFLLTAVMASLPVLHCAADRLVYAYDQRGNRISRVLEVPNRMSAPGTASLFATESLSGKTLIIYPNPTEGALKVEKSDSHETTIPYYNREHDIIIESAMACFSAMTIGHYSLGPENYQASWTDNLFVHEYGHYIQTQQMGFWYFPIVALPSITSAAFTSELSGMEHSDRWFEVDASNKGAKYFDKHYGSGKDGYTKNSEHYFDVETFRNPNKISPYMNKRFGSRYQSSYFPNTKGKIVIWDFIF